MYAKSLDLKLITFFLIAIILFGCGEKKSEKKFILVAHRGVVGEGITENSLASLEGTIKEGYTHVEVDLRCTKDGTVICFHDRSLKRVYGIDKDITELTLPELNELTANSTIGAIPTFDEFCSKCQGSINLMPDIKSCKPAQLDQYVANIERIMKKYNLLKGALIIGDKEVAEKFYGIAKIAWRDRLDVAQKSDMALNNPSKYFFIFNHGEHFDKREIDGFHKMGLQIIVSINAWHYPNDDPDLKYGKADIKRLIALGVDGLQIDSQYGDYAFSCLKK